MTYDSALMASVYGQMERPAEGLSVLTEALAHAHTDGGAVLRGGAAPA